MNPKFVEGLRWLQNEFPGHEVTVHYTPPTKKIIERWPFSKKDKEFVMKKDIPTISFLSVAVEVAGAHKYPESTRSYLQHLHRHDFRVSVVIGVTERNRQFEFYDVQDSLRKALDSLFVKVDNSTYNFGTRSCEHISHELFHALCKEFPIESISVFEDEYNGATVVKNPKVSFYNRIYNVGGMVPPGDE